jgi:CheY-like chemotaxis protein
VRTGEVEISKLFGALRGMMRPLTSPDAVALHIEEVSSDIILETDEGKLSQILRNLVSNALKFTEKGEVRVTAHRDGADLVLSVADTGIGIAPEDQERIFHEFAQIEGPVQRRVKGTGLGLPLSRKLAGLLGGSLQVKSDLGKGSTFELRIPFPARDLPAAETITHHASVKSDHTESILIIDDEEVARYVLRQHFRGTRYFIAEAQGGVEGIERARFDQPRLILLDIGMPDLNGFDVLDELKGDPATKHIPVIIHTSRKLSEEDLVRLKGRALAVLPKDLGSSEPAWQVIRDVLDEPHLFSTEEASVLRV